MQIEIRPITVDECDQSEEFWSLVAEYAAECANQGLPPPKPDMGMYRAMEAGGALSPIGAFNAYGQLIGFVYLLLVRLPHYSAKVAISESIFVAKEHRKTGAGALLIRAVESEGIKHECVGVFMSAPVGGTFERVLPGIGYGPTNTAFFKALQ